MNHDASHCLDYKKNQCPKTCYRAQLTEELRNINYYLPTSWVHFNGTQYCPKWKEDDEEDGMDSFIQILKD